MEYGILGGGALGLTLALRLAQRGEQVTLFEREALPGGLAAGFRVGGAWLEKFYHHLFRSDTRIIALIRELGLEDRLVWPRPRTVTLIDGQAHQLDSPTTLLRFRPLSPVARLRLGAALAYLRALPDPGPLEGQRAAPWIRRWMGEEAYDLLWGPLLRQKFGPLAEEIALPWFWARVHDRSTELGYLRGGFQQLYDALAARVRELGGTLHFGHTVTGVTSAGHGTLVVEAEDADGGRHDWRFERVVSTLPTRLTARLVPELPARWRERYDWGQAYGAHCLILALDRPLTESYWMNITDTSAPFTALVEHTNYMPPQDYDGRHLVYLGNYRPMDDPLFRMSADEVLRLFTPYLKRIEPAFEEGWVVEKWAFGAAYAQPIVTTEYRWHVPPFKTPVAGLYLANMFQVYPHDRGQNYSVALAERLAARLAGQ